MCGTKYIRSLSSIISAHGVACGGRALPAPVNDISVEERLQYLFPRRLEAAKKYKRFQAGSGVSKCACMVWYMIEVYTVFE